MEALGVDVVEVEPDLEIALPSGNSKIKIKRNQSLAIELLGVTKGAAITATLIVDGKRQALGSSTAAKRGAIALVTLSFAKVGTYQLEVKVKEAIRRLTISVGR